MDQYRIFPLGDAASTIELGTFISEDLNEKVLAIQHWLQQHPFEGLTDILIAYSSLTVIYEPGLVKIRCKPEGTVYEFVKARLQEAYETSTAMPADTRLIRIPVCYHPSFGYDLTLVSAEKKLNEEEIIRLHTSRIYRVYMIGFLPGFPYMASLDERLSIPRKETPRQLVPAGSVGLAGIQTGIYPLDSPGGWQIIGRTPMKMFDRTRGDSFYVKVGDRVEFCPISMEEFQALSDGG